MNFKLNDIAKMIDHALLHPALTTSQLEQGIRIALKYDVASVCIMPCYVKRCAQLLAGSSIKTSTTIGFPHGLNSTYVKIAEATQALDQGGEELDCVVNITEVLSENWNYVRAEIKALIELIHDRNQKIKVIFENCYLNEAQKIRLCEICGELKPDWVKTSTGFGTRGAEVADAQLMRKHSPPEIQIKAAGGIRNLDSVLAFRAAGVTRVGCSRTMEILEECRLRLEVG